MGWLNLFDPYDKREGVQGFLKVNIQVVGPNDEPIIHDLADMKKAETEKNFFSQKTVPEGHQVLVDIYRAENLAPMNAVIIDSKYYVKLKYSGVYSQTHGIRSNAP